MSLKKLFKVAKKVAPVVIAYAPAAIAAAAEIKKATKKSRATPDS